MEFTHGISKEGEVNDANIITLENGGIYKGEIQNDLPSGTWKLFLYPQDLNYYL